MRSSFASLLTCCFLFSNYAPARASVTIENIRLIDYKIPRTKTFVTSKGQSDACFGIFVLIDASDGPVKRYTALGDCLPRTKVTAESAADAWAGANAMAEALKGKQIDGSDQSRDVQSVRDLLAELNQIAIDQKLTWKNPPAKDKQLRATLCGFDEALLDLVGQVHQVPIYELLGGAKRPDVSVSAATFGADTQSDEVDSKAEENATNYAAIRMKFGLDNDEDLKKIGVVAKDLSATHPQCIIWIDANQAWTNADKSLEMLGKIRDTLKANDFKATFICEQPTLESDLPALAAVTKAVRTWNPSLPFKMVIMADEAMWTLDDAKNVVAADACDYVNIKIQKAGGLLASKDIGDYLARAAPNMGVYVGGVVTTDVTSWANLQLCYALPRLDLATGCIPRRAYKVNVAAIPVEYDNEKVLKHPTEPGLGTGLDMAKLQEFIHHDTASAATQNSK